MRAVLGFDGGIAVLGAGGRLAGLRERDLATRLDLLFAKGLHGVALNVAEAAQVHPVATVVDRGGGRAGATLWHRGGCCSGWRLRRCTLWRRGCGGSRMRSSWFEGRHEQQPAGDTGWDPPASCGLCASYWISACTAGMTACPQWGWPPQVPFPNPHQEAPPAE